MISKLLFAIALEILGVVVILAEFLLPSAGLLTLAAIAIFGYALFYVFTNISYTAGILFIGLDIILIPLSVFIGIKILAKTPLALKKTLSSKDGAVSQEDTMQFLVGKEGVVVTDCRPAGRALIENKRYDIVSEGNYIEKDTPIVVVAVNGNRVVVKKSKSEY